MSLSPPLPSPPLPAVSVWSGDGEEEGGEVLCEVGSAQLIGPPQTDGATDESTCGVWADCADIVGGNDVRVTHGQ